MAENPTAPAGAAAREGAGSSVALAHSMRRIQEIVVERSNYDAPFGLIHDSELVSLPLRHLRALVDAWTPALSAAGPGVGAVPAGVVDAYRSAVLAADKADREYYPDQASEDECRRADRAEASARAALDATLSDPAARRAEALHATLHDTLHDRTGDAARRAEGVALPAKEDRERYARAICRVYVEETARVLRIKVSEQWITTRVDSRWKEYGAQADAAIKLARLDAARLTGAATPRAGGDVLPPAGARDVALTREAAELAHRALGKLLGKSEAEGLREAGAFLLDRLEELSTDGDAMTEDGARSFYGHVAPAMARLRSALVSTAGGDGAAGHLVAGAALALSCDKQFALARQIASNLGYDLVQEREPEVDPGQPVRIGYTNWRGEQTTPTIVPTRVLWGSNEWHPEPCWLVEALDVSKQALRTFDLRKIRQAEDGTPPRHRSSAVTSAGGADPRVGRYTPSTSMRGLDMRAERIKELETALAAAEARAAALAEELRTAWADALEKAAKVADDEGARCSIAADCRDAKTSSGTALLTMEIGGKTSAKQIAAHIRALRPESRS